MPDSTKIEVPSPALSGGALNASATASGSDPKRVVVTPDQLLRIFERRLQQAAEKAVESAAAYHVNARVDEAVTTIEHARETSIRAFEEHCVQYRATLVASLSEEVLGRLQADLVPVEQRIQEKLSSLMQAQETAQAFEKKAGEAHLALTDALDLAQTQVQELQDRLFGRMSEAADRAATEATEERQRFETSLTAHAAETRADFEARQSASLAELAHASDLQIDGFRRQLEEIVSSMVGVIAASNEQSKLLLDSLAKDTAQRLREVARGPNNTCDQEVTR